MLERFTLLLALELSIARGSAERRAGMALRLADLFVQGSAQYPEPLIDLFDDLLSRIAAEADTSVLVSLAQRLARVDNAPARITRMLANAEQIEVACPVLARSPRLDEATLLNSVRTKGHRHLLAISWRGVLSETLTDLLIERGSRQIVWSTVKNPGARLSLAAFCSLAKRAQNDTLLAALIAARPDLMSLLARVPERIRTDFINGNQHIKTEVARVFSVFVDVLPDRASAPPTYDKVFSVPKPLQRIDGEDAPSILVADDLDPANPDPAIESVATVLEADFDAEPPIVSAAVSEQAKDRRRSARQKNFLRGRIFFNNRDLSVECLIRDLSETGARVIVSDAVSLPSTVEFSVPQKNRTWQARVGWRHRDEAGLSFVDASSGAYELSNELAKRLAELECELAVLRTPIKQLIKRANSGGLDSGQ